MKNVLAVALVALACFALGWWIQDQRWERKLLQAPRQSDTVWTPYSVPAKPETLWLPSGRPIADAETDAAIDSLLAVVANKDSLIREISRSYLTERPLVVASATDTLTAKASILSAPLRRNARLILTDPVFSGRSPLVTTTTLIQPPQSPAWVGFAQNGLFLTGGYFVGKENALGAVSFIGLGLLMEAFK